MTLAHAPMPEGMTERPLVVTVWGSTKKGPREPPVHVFDTTGRHSSWQCARHELHRCERPSATPDVTMPERLVHTMHLGAPRTLPRTQ